jgi:hypothetical protein
MCKKEKTGLEAGFPIKVSENYPRKKSRVGFDNIFTLLINCFKVSAYYRDVHIGSQGGRKQTGAVILSNKFRSKRHLPL